jgi:hypothetical protein
MKKLLNDAVNELIERANNEIKEIIRTDDQLKITKRLSRMDAIRKSTNSIKTRLMIMYPEDKQNIERIDNELHEIDLKITYLCCSLNLFYIY